MLKTKESLRIITFIILGIVVLMIFPVLVDVIYNIGVYVGTKAREIGECIKY